MSIVAIVGPLMQKTNAAVLFFTALHLLALSQSTPNAYYLFKHKSYFEIFM